MRARSSLSLLSGALVALLLAGCGGGGTPSIIIGGGVNYVAVGSGGSIYSSTDGTTWKAEVSGTTLNLQDVVWNGTVFCAVGSGGTILRSTDGSTWTSIATTITAKLNAVAANASGLVCAVGDTEKGQSVVLLSSDNGVTWKPCNDPTGLTQNLNGICWDGARFTVVGDGGFTSVSSTGETWQVPLYTTPTQKLLGVARFMDGNSTTRLALGVNGGVFQSTQYSQDWTKPATIGDVTFSPVGIASSGSRAVVSGYVNQDGGRIFTATAPNTWSPVLEDKEKKHALTKVAWDGSRFIALGFNGSVVVSSDGTASSWTYGSVPATTETLSAIACR